MAVRGRSWAWVCRMFDLDLDNDGQIGKTGEDKDRNGIVDGSEKFSYEVTIMVRALQFSLEPEEPTMTILIEIGMS